MSDIKELISAACPQAVFTEGGEYLEVSVPEKLWHDFATRLKNDPELGFDVLSAVVGMDWKDAYGVMYYLTSTGRGWDMLCVKVVAEDRKDPMIHSVSDLWGVANFQEREVYDFFGIKFINHPDMRRMFMRNDWVGHPLRKDYDTDPKLNPIRLDDEVNEDDTVAYLEDENGKIKKTPGKVFEENEYIINIGPQHPSTHGVISRRSTSSPVISIAA